MYTRHGGRLLALFCAVTALALPSAVSAATPTAVVTGNPDCTNLSSTWLELKVDRPPEAKSYSDGTLTVTFSNLDGNKEFDWSSNVGVDAIIVKAGTQAYIYQYDPEATAGTDVGAKAQQAISHVSFCYDTADTPPPPPDPCGTSDTDGDGFKDLCDVCPSVDNPGQEDTDGDGMGDACEPPPPPPTCAEQNAGSLDSDGDGTVDACDETPQPVITTSDQPGPTPQPEPQPGSAAEQQPGQIVLGERVTAPSARLLAPSGCAGNAFTAGVRGTQIARVVFLLDGKRVKTVTKPNSRGIYAFRVDTRKLRFGVHRIVARVTYRAGSPVRSKTLRGAFQRCGRQLVSPRFTG